MTDIKTVAPALSELIVEFGENSITVKRVHGGPVTFFSLKEWADIKAGRYDPPEKK